MTTSRSIRTALSALAVAGFLAAGAPAFGADAPAKDEGGFRGLLKWFDFFSDDEAVASTAPKPKKPAVRADGLGIGVEIPLDGSAAAGKAERGGDFLYLEGGVNAVAPGRRTAGAFKSGVGAPSVAPGASLLDSPEMRGPTAPGDVTIADPFIGGVGQYGAALGTFTPRYTALQFGVSYLPGAGERNSLAVGVSSSMVVADDALIERSFLAAPILGSARRIYNVGLNVGYGGVTLGASFQRERATPLASSSDAYDVGVQYQRGAFSTSVQFAASIGRNGERVLFGTENGKRVYAYEFGAAYRIARGVSLAGSVQYFDYRVTSLRMDADDAAVFYLGTNVNF